MKHVVMGTAGHVDHGKTTLVKVLTGVDTDRLEEEKRRGMTIELGFAPFCLPNGITVSIVDVPGHEKFIKTMLAGATGIDFALLVVAADEGVMPQTKEHLDILSLLNIDSGIVAITKCDLVDEDWLELVKDDVRKVVDETTLKGAPIIPVSSVTKEGIEELVRQIEYLATKTEKEIPSELFRMPIDRSFTLAGYGTIVTGTLAGGMVSKGDTVEVLPSGKTARVRGIQVHGSYVAHAYAGERCALNLTGVDKSDVKRGDTIAFPGVVSPVSVVDAVLYTVKGENGILHNQRVHIHVGTREIIGRIRIIGADKIDGDSKGYVQLKFEEPAIALRGDRFIIRSYSPVKTLGGGVVVFHSVPVRSRMSDGSINILKLEEEGSNREIIDLVLKNSYVPKSIDDLWFNTFISKSEIQRVINEEIESGDIISLDEVNKFLNVNIYNAYLEQINVEFEKYYQKYPFRFQIDKEEIKNRIFSKWEGKDFTALIDKLIEQNILVQQNNVLIQKQKNMAGAISSKSEVILLEKAFLEDTINPRRLQQLAEDLHMDQSTVGEVLKFLIQMGKLVDLGEGVCVHREVFDNVKKVVKDTINNKGSISVAELRDCIGSGRKLAIALMEYLDRMGFTQRSGDLRYPGVLFNS